MSGDSSVGQIYIFRHYHTGRTGGAYETHDQPWCTYRLLHKQDDSGIADIRLPDELTRALLDGDEIEVVVRPTGRKLTTRWEWVAPHEYACTSDPKSPGCPECRAAFPIEPAPDKGDT